MSTTVGSMGEDVHNVEKEMEYYSSKLHQVNKHIEVIIFYDLSHTWILFLCL